MRCRCCENMKRNRRTSEDSGEHHCEGRGRRKRNRPPSRETTNHQRSREETEESDDPLEGESEHFQSKTSLPRVPA